MNYILKGLKFILIWAVSLLMFFIIGCNSDTNKSETKQQKLYQKWRKDYLATADSFYNAHREEYDSTQLKLKLYNVRARINFVDTLTFNFLYNKLQNYLLWSNDSIYNYPNLYVIVRIQEGYITHENFILIVLNDTISKAVHYKVGTSESNIKLIHREKAQLSN